MEYYAILKLTVCSAEWVKQYNYIAIFFVSPRTIILILIILIIIIIIIPMSMMVNFYMADD